VALNFVAVPDGAEDDPKLLGLATMLKVGRPIAFWWVFRFHRLVVLRGNHLTGVLPTNYTAADLASFLEFKGPPARLINALKRQGYLVFRRGKGFADPNWRSSITGHYAEKKEADRRWHEVERKKKRDVENRPSADVVRQVADASADRRTTSARNLTVSKEVRGSGPGTGPPGPPLERGGSLAASRWAWLLENAPTPQNPAVCMRILETMPAEDWAIVQVAYGVLATGGPSSSRRKTRVLQQPTDRFLRNGAYWQFRPKSQSLLTASKPKNGATSAARAAQLKKDEDERREMADRFIVELLNDPETDADTRKRRKDLWLQQPENAGRKPPWETESEGGHGHR
jgi:hypothetical protein